MSPGCLAVYLGQQGFGEVVAFLFSMLGGAGIYWSTSVERVRPSGQLQNPALHATLRDHQRLSSNSMLRVSCCVSSCKACWMGDLCTNWRQRTGVREPCKRS